MTLHVSRFTLRVWFGGWAAFALALTVVPYLVAALWTPPGQVFCGSLLNADDTAQFLAAMRQGVRGGWLYRNPFTPEGPRPMLMYPLYMAWGEWARALGLDAIVAYHLLRLVGAVLLLLALQRLVRTLLPMRVTLAGGHPPLWQTAFLLAVFSSGLGWLMALLPPQIGMRYMADLSMLEASTFQSMWVVPHFAWGLALELLTFFCFLRAVGPARAGLRRSRRIAYPARPPGGPDLAIRAERSGRAFWRWTLGGALACLGVGLTYPFTLVVACAVLGAFVALALVTRRDWAVQALLSALVIAALPAALIAYYAVVFWRDPLWRATHVGASTGAPPALAIGLGYGLVLLLAVVGAAWVLGKRRWQDRRLGFLLVWAVVNGVMIGVPVPFRGRFMAGWHAALSVLAALGLGWLTFPRPRLGGYGALPLLPTSLFQAKRVRNVALILTVPSTVLALVAGPYMAIAQGGCPFYLPREELQAVEWLAGVVGEQDVVLASYAMGNWIPTRAPCRVFVGHQFASYRLQEKLALLQAFLAADTPDAERRALLRDYGVTFVYHGRMERDVGGFDPAQAPYLEQVYDAGGVRIYAVRL